MTAAGDVSDFGAVLQAELIASFASALVVPAADVSLRVSAASAHLLFTVVAANAADALAIFDRATVWLSNPANASSDLGVVIESAPVVMVNEPTSAQPTASLEPSPPPPPSPVPPEPSPPPPLPTPSPPPPEMLPLPPPNAPFADTYESIAPEEALSLDEDGSVSLVVVVLSTFGATIICVATAMCALKVVQRQQRRRKAPAPADASRDEQNTTTQAGWPDLVNPGEDERRKNWLQSTNLQQEPRSLPAPGHTMEVL